MNEPNTNLTTPAARWIWPLQLEHYDQTPSLNLIEREALVNLFTTSDQTRLLRKNSQAEQELERLLQPIHDSFTYIHTHENSFFRARRVLLLEMHQRARTFWSWTSQEWAEIITPSRQAFAQRYEGDEAHDGRLQLVALAYLLCPHLPVAPLLCGIQCFSLARNVFGEKVIREAVQRLITLLQSWGYEQHYQADLLSCLSYLFLYNHSPCLEDLSSEVMEGAARTCPLRGNVPHA